MIKFLLSETHRVEVDYRGFDYATHRARWIVIRTLTSYLTPYVISSIVKRAGAACLDDEGICVIKAACAVRSKELPSVSSLDSAHNVYLDVERSPAFFELPYLVLAPERTVCTLDERKKELENERNALNESLAELDRKLEEL